MSKEKVWLVTGCSSGFGRLLGEELLRRQQRVILTARNPATLADLARAGEKRVLALPLDVTRPEEIQSAVKKGLETFGRIDVLVNNAGYGVVGALEEVPASEIQRVFDTNVFGLMEMTRAVLPAMRAQKSGWIINLSSIAGFCASPGFGIYNSTKFAVEGISEALAAELQPFGIRVVIVEPGPFRTDFISRSLHRTDPHQDYGTALAGMRTYVQTASGKQAGDPQRAAQAIADIVDHPQASLRLPLGKTTVERMRAKLAQVSREIDLWEKVAIDADFKS